MNDRSAARRHPYIDPSLLPPRVELGGRRRMLEGALRLFATQGFHGSSMRELAKAVDLQPSALYLHFPSKEHILAELVRLGHEAHHGAIRAALLEAGNDPVAQLGALVRGHVTMHATYPHLAIVVNREMDALPPELAAPGLALRSQSSALLLQVLERGISLKRFVLAQPYVAAAAISAMGLRVPHWYSPASGLSVDDLAEQHVELALRLVGATCGHRH